MNTFKKEERLCSKLIIDKLFKSGSSFLLYPFRVQVLPYQVVTLPSYRIQVLFVAPKKRFKKAVCRNLIKRRMREIYRLHKSNLYQQMPDSTDCFAFSFTYVGNQIHDYAFMEKKFLKILTKLGQNYLSDAPSS